MTSFSAGRTSSETWWEIQHRYADLPDRWATTALGQFGEESIALLRAAVEADAFQGFVSDHRFGSKADASRYLIEFARVAVCHKSMSFRVARIIASISMEAEIEVTPPKVCGEFGYYAGQLGLSRDSRKTEALYCQKSPGHSGEHGPRRKVKVAA